MRTSADGAGGTGAPLFGLAAAAARAGTGAPRRAPRTVGNDTVRPLWRAEGEPRPGEAHATLSCLTPGLRSALAVAGSAHADALRCGVSAWWPWPWLDTRPPAPGAAALPPPPFLRVSAAHPLEWCEATSELRYAAPAAAAAGGGAPPPPAAAFAAFPRDDDAPLPPRVLYFELTVVSPGDGGVITLGVCPPSYAVSHRAAHPGWQPGSAGYHGDDGHLFLGSGRGARRYGVEFGRVVGDVVGCGLVLPAGDVFFTRNGVHLGVAACRVPLPVIPVVAMRSPGASVVLNFGNAPFAFQPRGVRV